MGNKSLLGNLLTFCFSLAAYVVYIISMVNENTEWMIITAFIYFLPLFVDFVEDFQNIPFKNKKWFNCCIGLLIISLLYIVFIVAYLSLPKKMEYGFWLNVIKITLIILPVVCLPVKAYPLFVSIMQLWNRIFGGH